MDDKADGRGYHRAMVIRARIAGQLRPCRMGWLRSLAVLCGAILLDAPDALPAAPATPYELGLGLDITLGVSGATAMGAGALLRGVALPPAWPRDRALVFAVDRPLMASYSRPLDLTSDVTLAAAIAAPAITLVGRNLTDMATVLAMYAETLALAQGTKELLKSAFPRYRPYMYFDPPPELLTDTDRYAAFPSGHSTIAFASAAFLASVFAAYHPDSPWRIPVALGGFALAGATAAIRIAGGQHFLTDTIAGAALGSLIGFGVPLMHRTRATAERAAPTVTLHLSFSVQ